MSPDQHAAVIVATMASLPPQDDPRPVPATALYAAFRHAIQYHSEVDRMADPELWRLIDAVVDRVAYHPD